MITNGYHRHPKNRLNSFLKANALTIVDGEISGTVTTATAMNAFYVKRQSGGKSRLTLKQHSNTIRAQQLYRECNMTKQTAPKSLPVNLKEQRASHTFKVMIRDTTHFYKIVNWLNSNVGKGEDKWTMEGRPLKSLKQGKTVNPKVYIFRSDFDPEASLYLSLL